MSCCRGVLIGVSMWITPHGVHLPSRFRAGTYSSFPLPDRVFLHPHHSRYRQGPVPVFTGEHIPGRKTGSSRILSITANRFVIKASIIARFVQPHAYASVLKNTGYLFPHRRPGRGRPACLRLRERSRAKYRTPAVTPPLQLPVPGVLGNDNGTPGDASGQ